ncbi:ATP-binding cassette sub-family C member 8-like isoform X1 [Ptychodera flava]|uniref:ATP-binding cassette sub-family C member 8-like isoform X1 n=1 Tax=Ptychodera flava TaxID=63121 RepID=UPI00396A8410
MAYANSTSVPQSMVTTSPDRMDTVVLSMGLTTLNKAALILSDELAHGLFLVVAVTSLIVLSRCSELRHFKARIYAHYPGHNFKYFTSILLIFVLVSSMIEGIFTAVSRTHRKPVGLFLPQAIRTLSAIVSLVYYQRMEYWNKPRMACLLVVYWLSAVVVSSLTLVALFQEIGTAFHIFRFDAEIVLLILYLCCMVIELNVIRTKLLKWCYVEGKPSKDMKKTDLYYTADHSNFLKYLLGTSFMRFLTDFSDKANLEMSDLGSVPENHRSERLYKDFLEAFSVELERQAEKPNYKPSLLRTFWRLHKYRFVGSLLIKILADTAVIVPGFLLRLILAYVTAYSKGTLKTPDTQYVTVEEYFTNAFVLTYLMLVANILYPILWISTYHTATVLSVQWVAALRVAIYEKSICLSSSALLSNDLNAGHIVNYVAVDGSAIQRCVTLIIFLITVPYALTITFALLYSTVGLPALAFLLVSAIILPIQLKFTGKVNRFQTEAMAKSDQRVKKTNEMLQGMKLIKLYGWEDLLSNEVQKVRRREMSDILSVGKYSIFSVTLPNFLPTSMALVMFTAMAVTSPEDFLPENVFPALTLLNSLISALTVVAPIILMVVQAYISSKRIAAFLALDKMKRSADGRSLDDRDLWVSNSDQICEDEGEKVSDLSGSGYIDMSTMHETAKLISETPPSYTTELSRLPVKSDADISDLPRDVAIQVENGQFSWDDDGQNIMFKDISTTIPAEKLTVIIGVVGSGKSSLLSAILGEMNTISGRVTYNRQMTNVSYSAQTAWLLNTTLKENILFGEPFDQERYEAVLSACALYPDLSILPAGDMTEIGEKGVNLSGGQKQRISVARAMYAKSDIVFLDDPLSALDVHVGAHMMEEGIMKFLLGEQRTVILVTHQLQYVNDAHLLIIMENGEIRRQGSLREISRTDKALFEEWRHDIEFISDSESGTEEKYPKPDIPTKRRTPAESTAGKDGTLISREEDDENASSLTPFYLYLKAIKFPFVGLILVVFILTILANIALNLTLAFWSEANSAARNHTQASQEQLSRKYLIFYSAEGILFLSLVLATSAAVTLFCIKAAKRLHDKMLCNVIHAPLRFFDITPIGRILNRFSNDIAMTDEVLWNVINSFTTFILQIISNICLAVITLPLNLALTIPFAVILGYFLRNYIQSFGKLQRMEAITKSPMLANLSETLQGLQSIRAYRKEHVFRRKMYNYVNSNSLAMLSFWGTVRMITMFGNLINYVGLFAVCVAIVAVALTSGIEASYVGLCITSTIALVMSANWMFSKCGELVLYIKSVQRIDEYSDLELENYQGKSPTDNWPSNGDIKFQNISVRYADHLDAVLRHITLHVKSGQKIGICGRTGSGKSSLTLALFRIIQTFKGKILIDDVDISATPLLSLRNRLAIIPQDPVLFSGTVRYNLDPAKKLDDDSLWKALETAQLKDIIKELPGQLDGEILEGGENFSVGQRQLFCLARAFLRRSKILVMDEATASIDTATDAVVQEVIANNFDNCTIITIAHRIGTILNYDKILVLSEGKIVEFDTPSNLLMKETSVFASMVREGR